ncbi:MAG TPA: hypothetical protein V6C76_10050 [Drouetiella sp.]
MRNSLPFKIIVLGIAGSTILVLPANARRAYDSSGSTSQSSSTTPNPYATQNATTTTTTSESTNSTPFKPNQYTSPQSQYTPPQNQYSTHTPPQNQYTPQNQYSTHTPPQTQYTPQNQFNPPQNQPGLRPYPHQATSNGTNFYGISPAQLSGGAAVNPNTYIPRDGVVRGGYDARWNPNFGTGNGAQTIARESGGLMQSLRDNFPLPMSGDEAQIFQVNDFAARSNGAMQSRRPQMH